MYTLTLEAKNIPDGLEVRKVTGTTYYTLRKKLKIYGEDHREIGPLPGTCFLVGTHVNAILETKKLSIDFEQLDDIARWIDEHYPYGDET